MTDTQQPRDEVTASEDFEPGTVDEKSHGWAPDAPGTGEAKQRVIEANKKAWEANDTQREATGAARQGLTADHRG